MKACISCACSGVAVSPVPPVCRLSLRYGFGDGQIGDPDGEPTEEDVKALMCKTNEFFTESIQNYTEKPEVEFYATEISYGFEDWIYNGTENRPVPGLALDLSADLYLLRLY